MTRDEPRGNRISDGTDGTGERAVAESVPGCTYWDWIRIIRRIELGFGEGKKRVTTAVVQQIALVAVTYGDYPNGTSIRPSEARIARVTRRDVTVVRRCLKRLRELQLLDMVHAHRSPGRSGGPGTPAEYRLTMPEGIFERVAGLDPDEEELIIPAGAEAPPVYSPTRNRKSPGAAPLPIQKSEGAAPANTAPAPVDNHETPGAAPGHKGTAPINDRVQPLESPGAAPQMTGGTTLQPNQSPNQSPSHSSTSRNLMAELEGSTSDAMNEHEIDSDSGQAPLDYTAAQAILQALPDLGLAYLQQAGLDLPMPARVIAAARLARAAQQAAPPRLVALQSPKRRAAGGGVPIAYQPVILQGVPSDPPTEQTVDRAPDGSLKFGADADSGRATA